MRLARPPSGRRRQRNRDRRHEAVLSGHPLLADFTGPKFQAGIALPEDRSFSGLLVNEDKRGLALAIGLRRSSGPRSRRASSPSSEAAGRIIPDLARRTASSNPTGAGHHGARDLPAGQNFGDEEFNLGIEGREVRKSNDCVGGVKPHAHDIHQGKILVTETLYEKIGDDAREMREQRV